MQPGTEAPRPLEGSLVRLRALEESDARLLNPFFNDPEVLENLTLIFPQPVAGFVEFWKGQRGDPSRLNLAIETLEGGETIGACGLEGIGLSAAPEFGIWIGRPWWNRGCGTDATRTLCRFAFSEMGVHRVTLHVYTTNPRAVRAYEKVGFKLEGTQREDMFKGGRWIDSHVMGLLASEFAG